MYIIIVDFVIDETSNINLYISNLCNFFAILIIRFIFLLN